MYFQLPPIPPHLPYQFVGQQGDCLYVPGNHAYMPNAFQSQATMLPQAFVTPQDPSWNMDTGATSHLADNTCILTSFSNSSMYPSVFVGNGHSIHVTHTGHSFLHTSSKPLQLNHILVTPHIIKNLILVGQFTHGNDVSVEFDAYGFSVKDYQIGRLLLHYDSTGDLYPVTQQPSSQTPVVLLSFSSTTWHKRLGHLGDDVLHRKHDKLSFFKSESSVDSVYPLHKKFDLFDNFVAFRAYVNKQFNVDIKALQCDHAGEYDNTRFHDLFCQNGMQFRFSCRRTSQQNGKSERMLRTINNLIRTLLFQAHIPPSYWVEALNMVAHLLNILPSTAINNEIPFTKLYNQTHTYEHLRVFGCLCHPHVDVSHKLEPRSTPCIFLGYPANHRGYRCLDLASNKIIILRHVRFDEDVFPFGNVMSSNKPTYDFLLPPIQTTTNVPTTEPFVQHIDEPDNPITPHPTTPPTSPPQPDTPPSHSSTPIPTLAQTQSHAQTVDIHTPIPINNSSRTMPTHPMVTRAKAGIFKPLEPNVNVVRSMWLFKHKFNADGSLSSLIVKMATIRTVLSLAVTRDWPIHQLDVKNAFLHGQLSETVYMHQPPGFVDSAHPDYVCHLQRSLYGLKQAHQAWF
ncbi:ribonuclease H-like domain-containing protein [Tanacetum coccineum]